LLCLGHTLTHINAGWPVKSSKNANFRLVYFQRENG